MSTLKKKSNDKRLLLCYSSSGFHRESHVSPLVCVHQMGGMEAVITGLTDDFKILKRNRKLFTFITSLGTFLVALLCVTNVSISAFVVEKLL